MVNPGWPQDPRNFGLAYRLESDYAALDIQLAQRTATQAELRMVAAPVTSEEMTGMRQRLWCTWGDHEVRPARAGYEKKPPVEIVCAECRAAFTEEVA